MPFVGSGEYKLKGRSGERKDKKPLTRFQEFLFDRKVKPSSCKLYLYVVGKYIRENPNYLSMDFNQISKWMGNYMRSKRQRPSMSLFQAAVKQFYACLFLRGFIAQHPCRNLKIKSRRKNVNPEMLFTRQELHLLLTRQERYKALVWRNRTIISLLIYQALSVGEICKLRTEDIDLEIGSIEIREAGTHKKRNLPLKPNQIILFQNYLAQSPSSSQKAIKKPLFTSNNGKPYSADSIHYLISTFGPLFPDRILNPKTIRKSVIANWLNDFHIPVEDVQFLAGHKQPTSTLRYKLPNIAESVKLVNLHFPQ